MILIYCLDSLLSAGNNTRLCALILCSVRLHAHIWSTTIPEADLLGLAKPDVHLLNNKTQLALFTAKSNG